MTATNIDKAQIVARHVPRKSAQQHRDATQHRPPPPPPPPAPPLPPNPPPPVAPPTTPHPNPTPPPRSGGGDGGGGGGGPTPPTHPPTTTHTTLIKAWRPGVWTSGVARRTGCWVLGGVPLCVGVACVRLEWRSCHAQPRSRIRGEAELLGGALDGG